MNCDWSIAGGGAWRDAFPSYAKAVLAIVLIEKMIVRKIIDAFVIVLFIVIRLFSEHMFMAVKHTLMPEFTVMSLMTSYLINIVYTRSTNQLQQKTTHNNRTNRKKQNHKSKTKNQTKKDSKKLIPTSYVKTMIIFPLDS